MQHADFIKQQNDLSYFVNRPVSVFRTYSTGLTQFNHWDFSGEHISSGAGFNLYLEFLNKWSLNTEVTFTSRALDTRILRGGPAMLLPWTWDFSAGLQTDPSERISAFLYANTTQASNNSHAWFNINPGLSVQPANPLKIEISFNYESNKNKLQYVTTKSVNDANQYILGTLDQKTLGLTFRIDYNFTPELSLQYYGSPFASVGQYTRFKTVTDPRADSYKNRFTRIETTYTDNDYFIADGYSFADPDFNFNQLRSNLVCRWEYLPGSQIYLVWTQDRTGFRQPGQKNITDTLENLGDIDSNNIFLIKVSYWFSI
jgi:hypothetical protein